MRNFTDILQGEFLADLIYKDNERVRLPFDGSAASIGDVTVTVKKEDGAMHVSLTADTTPVSWIVLRFPAAWPQGTLFYGDQWERGYGDLCWRGIVPERHMPWYFLAHDKKSGVTAGYGVRVRPEAMCVWHADDAGMTLFLDVRCGGDGVILGGKTLQAATVICREYENTDAFHAGREFCRAMCPDPIFAREPVYGSNNWYYAYGHSSSEEILQDTDYIVSLTEGLQNRPYMVIDDGWERNFCAGPWDRGNDAFPDMEALAHAMKAKGVKPGIWVRLLYDGTDAVDKSWKLSREPNILDPSVPEVLEHVKADVRRFVSWGFELIKHDYSTGDLFGYYGIHSSTRMTPDGWHFRDRSKTSAQVVLDFYRAIREAAKDAVVMGCNTYSHLCAGLVEVNRTGDDTSGREWERTRNRGVNTLAFRMMQNGTFYAADADCIGITEAVPWERNREWLRALSRSGSPLFMSSKCGVATPSMVEEIREAFRHNAAQTDELYPLDWMDTVCPARWSLNGEEITFSWYGPDGCKPI